MVLLEKNICDDNRGVLIRIGAISKCLSMTKLRMFNRKIIKIDDNSMTTCLPSIMKSLESDDYIIHFRSRCSLGLFIPKENVYIRRLEGDYRRRRDIAGSRW